MRLAVITILFLSLGASVGNSEDGLRLATINSIGLEVRQTPLGPALMLTTKVMHNPRGRLNAQHTDALFDALLGGYDPAEMNNAMYKIANVGDALDQPDDEDWSYGTFGDRIAIMNSLAAGAQAYREKNPELSKRFAKASLALAVAEPDLPYGNHVMLQVLAQTKVLDPELKLLPAQTLELVRTKVDERVKADSALIQGPLKEFNNIFNSYLDQKDWPAASDTRLGPLANEIWGTAAELPARRFEVLTVLWRLRLLAASRGQDDVAKLALKALADLHSDNPTMQRLLQEAKEKDGAVPTSAYRLYHDDLPQDQPAKGGQ